MKSKGKILIGIILFAVFFIGASQVYRLLSSTYAPPEYDGSPTSADADGETEKMLAPNVTVTDSDGNDIQLSDFRGMPVVLNFWASWCPPCKAEMPDFQEAFEEHGGEVTFLMVNATDGVRETTDTAAAFLAEAGYTFPVYYDTKQAAVYTYGISAFPTTVFLDSDGCLASIYTGMIDADTLQKEIEAVTRLSQEP